MMKRLSDSISSSIKATDRSIAGASKGRTTQNDGMLAGMIFIRFMGDLYYPNLNEDFSVSPADPLQKIQQHKKMWKLCMCG